MIVKILAVVGYVAAWSVIVIGIFEPVPWYSTGLALVLAFLGTLAAWDALPRASRLGATPSQPLQHPSQCCDGAHHLPKQRNTEKPLDLS